MKYVIGIDLGTSSVKALLVNIKGEICAEAISGMIINKFYLLIYG